MMKMLGPVLGVAIAIGMGAYFRSQKATRSGRVLQALAVIVVAGLSAAAVNLGVEHLWQTDAISTADETADATDKVMQVIKDTPLMGLVLQDNPGLEARFRAAAGEEFRNPTKNGPQRTFVVGTEVRKEFILPVLEKADDKSALGAVAAFRELIAYLRQTDVHLCREMGIVGLQHPDQLDAEGSALFKRILAAQADAYRSGRTSGGTPNRLTGEDAGRLLAEAGYTADDFDKLANLASLPDAEVCAATLKLYSAPTALAPDKAAQYARYLLSHI